MRNAWMVVVPWWCLGATVLAADGSLAEWIGADAALFVEVRELDRHWRDLAESELGRRWTASPKRTEFWQSPAGTSWSVLDAHVGAATGLSFTAHIRQLFGDAVALALYLPDDGAPRGMLAARAVSEAALDRALQAWDRVEPPLRIERKTTAGGAYARRVVKKGDSEQSLFFARRERVFLLSDHEALIRECLDRGGQRPAEASGGSSDRLSAVPEFAAAAARFPQDSVAVVFLQPRRWDAVLQRDFGASPSARHWMEVWKSIRSCSSWVTRERGLRLELLVQLDEERVSSEWRAFAEPSAPPSILSMISPETVAVCGARMRPNWLLAQWQQVLAERDREQVAKARRLLRGLLQGHDPLDDVAANLFGDWGLVLERHAAADSAGSTESAEPAWWTGWTLTGVFWPSSGWSHALRDGLDNALQFAANALAFDRNQRMDDQPWWLTRGEETGATFRVLRTSLDLQPAFGWAATRLAVSTHVAALRRHLLPPEPARPAVPLPPELSSARVIAWGQWQPLRERNILRHLPWPVRLVAELTDEATLTLNWTAAEIRLQAALSVHPPQ
uniref:DUF3352 domain-containing protein n=1 Tax=Schlesneria paludicola TaxID=360056 RepID=A0A7C4LN40_9PLAN